MINSQHIKKVYEESLFTNASPVADSDIQFQYIRKYIPREKKSAILDAGCGNGRYAQKLIEQGYRKVFSIDLFEQIPFNSSAFGYTQGRIEALPFRDNYFDFVYSNSVIYYLDNPEEGIKEFHRVLKPGCIVVITAHTKYSLFTFIRKIKKFRGDAGVAHLQGVNFYSAREYIKMLRQNGFKIMWVDGYRLSVFIYPAYLKIARLIKRYFQLEMPVLTPSITKNKILAQLKSVLAYHSVVVAYKL